MLNRDEGGAGREWAEGCLKRRAGFEVDVQRDYSEPSSFPSLFIRYTGMSEHV